MATYPFSKKYNKQLLLVTFCDTLAGIEVSFWADGTGRTDERTNGRTDKRGSGNSYLDTSRFLKKSSRGVITQEESSITCDLYINSGVKNMYFFHVRNIDGQDSNEHTVSKYTYIRGAIRNINAWAQDSAGI